MSTGILKFNLPEEAADFKLAQKAMDMNIALETIANEVFRPARKHGYADEDISQLFEEIGPEKSARLVSLLEDKFYAILNEYGVGDL